MSKPTIFERVAADKPDEHLFLSQRHGIMAAIDTYPRMPLQCVVAPTVNDANVEGHFNRLPSGMRQKMHEVADTLGEKVLACCTSGQRPITHIEGFGVADHPHIVVFAAERGQGADLYTGANLGPVAVQHTLEVMRFTLEEATELEARLDQIH